MRLLALHAALPGASQFFIDQIADRLSQGAKRILVSGTADTGLLEIIVQAMAQAGRSAEVVIADRCKTPLEQCRQYAQRLGLPVELHRTDIRSLQVAPVDIVIAHSFLLFFPEPDRQQVIETWARLTRPGATVLLFNPLSPDEHSHPMRLDRSGIPQRATTLAAAALDLGWDASQREEIQAAASQFWLSSPDLAAEPHITAANLKKGFEAAGFDVAQVTSTVRASATNGPFGVTAALTDDRAELIAIRR